MRTIARRVVARKIATDLQDILDDLKGLEALSDNLAMIESTFDLHFASKTAVDPEVESQFKVLLNPWCDRKDHQHLP